MATQEVVTAPLVIAKTSEGRDLYLYNGAAVPEGQSKDWLERHRRDKLIGKVDVQEREMPTDAGDDVVPPTPEGDEEFLAQTAKVIRAQASDVDEDRRARLVTAEEAGQNRTTVLAALRGDQG
jgi:hypothetical protein